MNDESTSAVKRNREILKSLIKCLQFCGRQGVGLRGHRDNDTDNFLNKGNFKALIQFRIDAGDKV